MSEPLHVRSNRLGQALGPLFRIQFPRVPMAVQRRMIQLHPTALFTASDTQAAFLVIGGVQVRGSIPSVNITLVDPN